jgi:hypothetical protein
LLRPGISDVNLLGYGASIIDVGSAIPGARLAAQVRKKRVSSVASLHAPFGANACLHPEGAGCLLNSRIRIRKGELSGAVPGFSDALGDRNRSYPEQVTNMRNLAHFPFIGRERCLSERPGQACQQFVTFMRCACTSLTRRELGYECPD